MKPEDQSRFAESLIELHSVSTCVAINNLVISTQFNSGGSVPDGSIIICFMPDNDAADDLVSSSYLSKVATHNAETLMRDLEIHHVLGVAKGCASQSTITVDEISVQPGWSTDKIRKEMIGLLRSVYPDATISFSRSNHIDTYDRVNPYAQ